MIEPARAAFLLIDMQNGFIDAASPLCIAGAAATVPACAHALAAAREHGLAVFHVRRAYAADGSDVEAVRWETWAEGGRPLSAADPASLDCPPELSPAPGEPVIMKPSWSAFFGTDLAALLRARGIGTLVLAGTTTPNCVRSTAYDGLALGFNVAVLRDATSSRSPEAQEVTSSDPARALSGQRSVASEAFDCKSRRGSELPPQSRYARPRRPFTSSDTRPLSEQSSHSRRVIVTSSRVSVAPAVEPFQTRELLQVGERRDAPFRTLHRADTLRLVARDAAVAIDVEFAQAVGLEGLVVKCQVDVSVLLVALVLGKAAGRREQ